MSERVAVLAMAYGTAAGPDDIERYYMDIRGGRPPSPELLAELKDRYAAIGNRFPLLEITRRQATALEKELELREPGRFKVYLGMKHSPPFIAEGVARIRGDGIRRGVGLVLAPHYSRMSVGTYIERVQSALREDGEPSPMFTFVESWYDNPEFIDILSSRVAEAIARLRPHEQEGCAVVFTAHSLPARIVSEGDPYPAQLQETADLVAKNLGLTSYLTAWQSAGRTPEPWLGPDLGHVVRELAREGHSAVVVCACGFVADHLEILYDLDIEARREAATAGITLVRTESMNDDPAFIRALTAVVLNHVRQTVVSSE
ncbi:MAG TPA: ferrochelatase [Actinomycetota bacterium]|nr:ferrochelatase [Actinomycetota bacterium]